MENDVAKKFIKDLINKIQELYGYELMHDKDGKLDATSISWMQKDEDALKEWILSRLDRKTIKALTGYSMCNKTVKNKIVSSIIFNHAPIVKDLQI